MISYFTAFGNIKNPTIVAIVGFVVDNNYLFEKYLYHLIMYNNVK